MFLILKLFEITKPSWIFLLITPLDPTGESGNLSHRCDGPSSGCAPHPAVLCATDLSRPLGSSAALAARWHEVCGWDMMGHDVESNVTIYHILLSIYIYINIMRIYTKRILRSTYIFLKDIEWEGKRKNIYDYVDVTL